MVTAIIKILSTLITGGITEARRANMRGETMRREPDGSQEYRSIQVRASRSLGERLILGGHAAIG